MRVVKVTGRQKTVFHQDMTVGILIDMLSLDLEGLIENAHIIK